jgi:hypothetical protein
MPGFLMLFAVIAVPVVVTLVALAMIGSAIALLAEDEPLVGRAR